MNVSAISTAAISQAFDRFNTAAATVAGAASSGAPTDTMKFTDAAIALSEAKIDVAANVRVFRAGQEMFKHTLDLFA